MRTPGAEAASRALLKRLARLHQRKYRDESGLFLAEGLRTVRELLEQMADPSMLDCLVCTESGLLQLPEASRSALPVFLAGEAEFAALAGTRSPQGVLGVFRQPSFPPPHERDYPATALVVVLDGVQDPGNAGTILRTAAWLGADALLSGPGTVDFYNPKSVRSSAGSLFSMPHTRTDDLPEALGALRSLGFEIVCSSLEGIDFRRFGAWPERTALVIGNEANGAERRVQAMADRLVKIPHGDGRSRVESLNAAVSAAILLERILLSPLPPATL